VITQATTALEQFDYAQALSLIEDFFWRGFCDNYIELAKGRTYEETLTEGRLSACVTLRLTHRALTRLFAPFIPFITDAVWSWEYANDPGMHPSIHRSPWPTIDEFSSVPDPADPTTWDATLAVLDATRRIKAEANKSMAAPIESATVIAPEAMLRAIEPTTGDIRAMLKIDRLVPVADERAETVRVEVVFAAET
ncbi:MAG TPA: class I tRNA ligase family protein, partial [Candidatus Hydrogenedentes bacterium]|nr:class I tRNA ligase family protein [Candidatus Hydrogenedentota bacterium]